MPGGRPPIYDSAEALQAACDAYFAVEKQNYTITGLALHLGFCDRQSLNDYEEKEQFSFIIKCARLKVENSYEKRLHKEGTPTGAIFALKNMGWRDKQETEHSGELGIKQITGMIVK